MKNKVALIFGITGQDGSYLAEYLLKKIILLMVLNAVHQV
jgi:GDP-D-mannose dehydratase